MQPDRHIAASEVLSGVVRNNHADSISLYEIKTALHERGFGLLMLAIALPLSIPVPVPPGMTALPALPLLLFSIQMIMGMDSPWLPKWLGEKRVKRQTLAHVIEKGAPFLQKIERFLQPRFSFASSAKGEKIVGIFCMVFSISIAIPLPLTNFIPALGIVFLSLGLLSKDGIAIVLGMIIGSSGLLVTTTVILFGRIVIDKLFLYVMHMLGLG